MDNLLGLSAPAPLSLTTLTINLLLGILLSTGLAWFYTRYGRSLSNRARFAQTLPVLTLTTVLVISVIKSSLALSLGLVGALSIVRFRTAIKDPEELIYPISEGLKSYYDSKEYHALVKRHTTTGRFVIDWGLYETKKAENFEQP